MTDKLSLYNGALLLMSETTLANLTENRESRRVLDAIWAQDPIKDCLELGQWQWASRAVRMDASPSVTPEFGYRYAFQKTDDYIRTCAISDDEYFERPYTRFVDEVNYLYADIDQIYVKFVSDLPAYGRDYSRWPNKFARLVESFIAMKAGPRLTGVTVSVETLRDGHEKARTDALNLDGSNRPTLFSPPGSWTTARHGRSGTRDLRRR